MKKRGHHDPQLAYIQSNGKIRAKLHFLVTFELKGNVSKSCQVRASCQFFQNVFMV